MELITNEMYSKLPNLILGFHGCGKDTYEKVLYEHQHLKKSENEYDWLGNGIYFWENNYQRARDWADILLGKCCVKDKKCDIMTHHLDDYLFWDRVKLVRL